MSDTLTNALGIASLLLLWGLIGHFDAEDEAALAEATRAGDGVPQEPPQPPLRLLCQPEVAPTSSSRTPTADPVHGWQLVALPTEAHPESSAGPALRCVIDND